MTDATYTGGDGEQYDRKTNRLVPGTGDPNAPPPQSTLPPGQGGAGASALGPQSPLQARFMKGMDKLEALQADEEKQFKAGEAAAQPLRDREMKELMTPVQARSHLEKLKDAPKPEDYQKGSMEFASSMALVGAVFGRFSRRGGTAALNAFSGALKGWHEGNMEAYGNAQKEWEANTKKTLENNQMEIEKYKEIIENKKLNIDQMSAALTLAAQPFQNKLMFDYAQEKNINGALNLYDKMVGIQEKAESSFQKLMGFSADDKAALKSTIDQYNSNPDQLAGLTNQQYQALRLAGERFPDLPKLNNPTVMLKGGGGAPGSDQVQAAVDMVGQYKENLATAMSRMPAQLKATFQQQLQAQYPDYDQKQFNAQNIEATTEARTAASRIAKVNYASNLLDQNIPAAEAAAKAFPQGKYVPIDAAKLWAARQGSNVQLSGWDVVNLQMIENYAQFLNPGSTTIRQDMFNAAASVFSQAKSTPAYLASLQAVKEAGAREREAGAETIRQQRGQGGAVPSGGGSSGGDVPQRPQNIPDGSAYSPSRKMWKDPQGNLYDASGAPAGL